MPEITEANQLLDACDDEPTKVDNRNPFEEILDQLRAVRRDNEEILSASAQALGKLDAKINSLTELIYGLADDRLKAGHALELAQNNDARLTAVESTCKRRHPSNGGGSSGLIPLHGSAL